MAEQFVVEDKMNRESGGKTYSVDEDNKVIIDQSSGTITIKNANGNNAFVIGLSSGVPIINMYDNSGNLRLSFDLDNNNPRCRMWDEDGDARFIYGYQNGGF